MDDAQAREAERVLGVALRMFEERAELARRLAGVQRRRGRPVSAEHWGATVREMEEAPRACCATSSRAIGGVPEPEGENDRGPGAGQGG
jgi:hypothetical protein